MYLKHFIFFVAVARCFHFYLKYEEVFEEKFSAPIRGILDAASDANILVCGNSEAQIIAPFP